MGKNRVIVRLLYNGLFFYGFQRQPGVKTVEGVIEKELRNRGCIKSFKESSYAASGRTDRGVSALSQTIAFETCCDANEVLNAINKYKPLIYAWAIRLDYSGEFNPRYWAILREYMYVHELTHNYDIDKAILKSKQLIGCKDYSFLNLPKDTNPYRCIFDIKIRIVGNYVVYNIIAESFARQMVRRIVSLLKNAAENNKDGKIELMPASNLLLLKVKYPYAMYITPNARSELVSIIRENARRVVVFDLLYHLYFSSSSWIYEFS